MSKTTLVILAAGIGSRYGGIKQLETVNKNGSTIIDYSLFDAIKVGFNKIVFVVREEIREEFKAVFDKKLAGKKLEIEYVNQKNDSIPSEVLSTKRTKPWGTGQALLAAKDIVNENFCVINGDDFYGSSAFEKIYYRLQKMDSASNEFLMVGYQVGNTVSENGSVSRGQCFLDEKGLLTKIIEREKIYKKCEKTYYLSKNASEIEISPNAIVSMNFWGFTPKFFDVLEKDFNQFLKVHSLSETAEFFLPKVVNDLIEVENAVVKVLKSEEKWMGVTYKEDRIIVEKGLRELQNKGIYPDKLW